VVFETVKELHTKNDFDVVAKRRNAVLPLLFSSCDLSAARPSGRREKGPSGPFKHFFHARAAINGLFPTA